MLILMKFALYKFDYQHVIVEFRFNLVQNGYFLLKQFCLSVHVD